MSKITVYEVWVNGVHKDTSGNWTTANTIKEKYEKSSKKAEIKTVEK